MPENEQLQAARRIIEDTLESGEKLLAVSKGSQSRLRSHWYYIGLTKSRFILQPLRRGKPSAEAHTIWRAGIEPPRWRRGLRRTLIFKLPKDTLTLHFGTFLRLRDGHWQEGAAKIAELAGKATPAGIADDASLARRRLQQAQSYQGLDFPASGRQELELALGADQDLGSQPAAKTLQKQLSEDFMALRAGGGFFLGRVVLDLIFIAALVYVAGGQVLGNLLGVDLLLAWALSLWIGTSLWRGRTRWRPWAILAAIVALFIYGLVNLVNLYVIDLVSQVGYSSAIILALSGRSSRTRTVIAAVIYLVAFAGTTFLQLRYLLF